MHFIKNGHDIMKGFQIDCNYLIPVCDKMKEAHLPSPRLKRPNRKLLDVDGSRLPLIVI